MGRVEKDIFFGARHGKIEFHGLVCTTRWSRVPIIGVLVGATHVLKQAPRSE